MNKRGKRLKSNNILPEYGLGSWIKDTAKKGLDLGVDAGLAMADRTLGTFGATNVIDDSMYNTKLGRGLNKVGDVINPLVGQATATALGGPMAGMAMNAGQQGISSATGSSPEQLAQEELNKEQDKALKYNQTVNSFNSQYNQSPTNIPTFRNGGIINYNGQSHNGPDGGIPIDDNGNPSIQSGNQPTGLTEDKEVAWKLPDGNTFIFSDSLGYAPVAKRIYSKYSKRLGKKMDKTDAISMKGLTQEFNDLAAEQEISKKMDGQKTGIKGTYRYGGTIDGEDGEESTKPTVSQPRSVSTKNISGIDMKFIPEPKPVKGKGGDIEMFIDDPSEWISDKARKDAQGRYIASTIKKDYEQKFPDAVSKYKEFAAKNPGYSQEDLDAFIVMNKDIFNKAVLDSNYAKTKFKKELIPVYESMYNKKENTGSSETGVDPSNDMFGLRHYTQDSKPFTPYQEYVTSGAISNISNPDALENYIRGYQIDNVEYTPEGYVYKVKQGKIPAGYTGFMGGTGVGEMFKNAKEVEYNQRLNDNKSNGYRRGGIMKKYDDGSWLKRTQSPVRSSIGTQSAFDLNSRDSMFASNKVNSLNLKGNTGGNITVNSNDASSQPEIYRGDNTMDYIGAGASMLGNTLQMLSNKRPGSLRLARVNPKTINLNNARTAMQDEARNTKVNLMRGLPSDVGYRANALKGIKDINQDVNKSILGSQTQEAMANAEIQNQAAAQNAEIQSQEALINAQRWEGYQNTQNAYKKAIMQAPIDALSRISSRANMFDMAQLNENYDIVKNPKTGRIQFIPKKK